MKIEYSVDEKYEEPKLIICTNKVTEELQNIINKIKKENEKYIYGYKDEKMYLLDEKEIETIYAENKKIYIRKEDGIVYECKKKLYELEEILPRKFVRISNSEIVNFSKVHNLDFKILGTIILNFQSKCNICIYSIFNKRCNIWYNIHICYCNWSMYRIFARFKV